MWNQIKKNWLAIFIWVMGLIFAGTNLYTSFRVSDAELVKRVEAVEKEQASDNEAASTLLPRFYVLETKVEQIYSLVNKESQERDKDVMEIKQSQVRLEDKIDKLLLKE